MMNCEAPAGPTALIIIIAGILMTSSQAQAHASRTECDRLIDVLGEKAPAEAHDALQKMQVYRDGNQYEACVEVGREEQKRSATQSGTKAQP